MDRRSRRTFLKLAALASPLIGSLRTLGQSATTEGSGVQAWQTAGTQRCARVAPPIWRNGAPSSGETIELRPDAARQDLLGFGAALTDASCYLLSQMDTGARQAFLRECFGEAGLGLSIARTTIGSSDYSRSAYTYDDTAAPDPDLAHFSIEHDRKYILPTLQQVQQVNPEVFYFSSPWSPPAWMKSGDTLEGGMMESRAFGPYADYLVKFIRSYGAEGIRIRAITVQNEIDTDQDGRMPQCLWGQEYEIKFVKNLLGPAFQKNGVDTKIWILDHNYNLWGRVADEFEDPDLSKYVDGVAWHGYYGEPERMTRIHTMFPDKNAYWTEGGSDYTAPDYLTDWAKWSGTFAGILNNWARCIVSWNLLLDEHGKPNIGPFACGGLVTRRSGTGELSRSGMYWAMMHHARFLKRGGRIFETRGEIAGVTHVAARNPDGTRVLVLTNSGHERNVQCLLNGRSLDTHLPADSVTTLVL